MDRQGYDNSGLGAGNTGYSKPMGERIAEAVPGTHQYQATHGADSLHQGVEKAKAYVPGTDEHRMRQAGVTDPAHTGHHTGILGGTGTTGTHTTGGQGVPMGERIKESIPGTEAYEATHGMTGAHRGVEQMKGYIPGTEEHRIKQATHPGTGGYESGRTGYHSHDATGMGAGTAGDGVMPEQYGTGITGTEQQHKPLGEKIKEHIPGTREHEAKKMQEGRF